MIGKLSASNTLFRSIYYSMRDLHDRVDTAKNLPNIKCHQKLQSMGICAYPECEKQFSHFAIHCPTCKIFYCVYCDGAETHDQKHGLVFSVQIKLINCPLPFRCLFVVIFILQTNMSNTNTSKLWQRLQFEDVLFSDQKPGEASPAVCNATILLLFDFCRCVVGFFDRVVQVNKANWKDSYLSSKWSQRA